MFLWRKAARHEFFCWKRAGGCWFLGIFGLLLYYWAPSRRITLTRRSPVPYGRNWEVSFLFPRGERRRVAFSPAKGGI